MELSWFLFYYVSSHVFILSDKVLFNVLLLTCYATVPQYSVVQDKNDGKPVWVAYFAVTVMSFQKHVPPVITQSSVSGTYMCWNSEECVRR